MVEKKNKKHFSLPFLNLAHVVEIFIDIQFCTIDQAITLNQKESSPFNLTMSLFNKTKLAYYIMLNSCLLNRPSPLFLTHGSNWKPSLEPFNAAYKNTQPLVIKARKKFPHKTLLKLLPKPISTLTKSYNLARSILPHYSYNNKPTSQLCRCQTQNYHNFHQNQYPLSQKMLPRPLYL